MNDSLGAQRWTLSCQRPMKGPRDVLLCQSTALQAGGQHEPKLQLLPERCPPRVALEETALFFLSFILSNPPQFVWL